MSLSLRLIPLTSPPKTNLKTPHLTRTNPRITPPPKLPILQSIKAIHKSNHDPHVTPPKPRWETMVSTASSLYPLYVTAGCIVAVVKPSSFSWFVKRSPNSYSLSLAFIMLAMGLTLDLNDLFNLFFKTPISILFGCAAQYTIMPALGVLISKSLGLPPSLSVGLILLSCCPGGTASNVVGMQNTALAVVLATSHFNSPMVALPAVMSAVVMNVLGGCLGSVWRHIDPSDPKIIGKLD